MNMYHNFRKSLEPGELLEENWFFGNLLDGRKTLKSCSSSNQENVSEKSYEETYESIKKLNQGGKEFPGPNLSRGTSMPVSCTGKKKLKKKSSLNNLVRAPSLPTRLFGKQEFDEDDDDDDDDEEIEFSMGRLIRTASLNDSEISSPKNKGLARSSNKSMHQSRMNPNLETIKFEPQKSFKDLESEELQGFKDMGFEFNDKDINTNVLNIIPGLQENETIEEDSEKNARKTRPYLSEVWHTESSSSHFPNWDGNRFNEEDMKEQIKYWAKSVASNVR